MTEVKRIDNETFYVDGTVKPKQTTTCEHTGEDCPYAYGVGCELTYVTTNEGEKVVMRSSKPASKNGCKKWDTGEFP